MGGGRAHHAVNLPLAGDFSIVRREVPRRLCGGRVLGVEHLLDGALQVLPQRDRLLGGCGQRKQRPPLRRLLALAHDVVDLAQAGVVVVRDAPLEAAGFPL